MDTNLYFRFMIPPWIGAIAAVLVNWAAGGHWITSLAGADDKDLVTLAIAVLASPAAGFLLSTFVVTGCHVLKRGPEYQKCFDTFKKRVETAATDVDHEKGTQIAGAMKRIKGAAVVAYFEYRTDSDTMLQWRRRQRAAFYVNSSSVLAIIFGVIVAIISMPTVNWRLFLVPPGLLLLIAALLYNCVQSRTFGDAQQAMWLQSLSDEDIRSLLGKYGPGKAIDPNGSDR